MRSSSSRPTYDLKYDPTRKHIFGHTTKFKHTQFPINPYIPATDRAKLFRSKSKKKITFKQIIRELEPYSLYPPEEIKRLLSFYSFFMLHYLSKGYAIDMPYFGQFVSHTETYIEPFKSKHKGLGDESNYKHDTIEFRPSPFVHWYLNPLQYTPYKYQHVPTYFRTFDKFNKELYASSHLDWFEIFPDKKYLKFAMDRLRCNGTINTYAAVDWVQGRKPKRLAGFKGKPLPKKVKDIYAADTLQT